MIVSRAGCLHRVFRTRLRNLARDSHGNYSDEPPFIYSHLSSVFDHWKDFVAHALTQDFKERSKINKERAETMEARYRKACVGYARLREQIIEQKLREGEEDPVVTRLDTWKHARMNAENQVDDPCSLRILEDVVRITKELEEYELNDIKVEDLLDRLIPLEYSGRVRGCGWGVTKRSLSSAPELSEMAKLKRQCNRLEKDMQEMKTKGFQPMVPSCSSSHMDNFDDDDDAMDSEDDLDAPDDDLPEGPIMCHLYVEKPHRHVGQGILHNRPKEILHGVPLPEGYARIQFEVAVESERHSTVPQHTDEVRTVGEAVGHFISWPKKLVSLKIECPPPKMNTDKSQKLPIGGNKPTLKTVESTVCAKKLGYPKNGDSPHNSMVLHILRFAPSTILSDIEVPIRAYFDGPHWDECIVHENILEILEDQ
ncbi:uncharacterized protein A4U43_C02F15620 [Asparagus officinalis]|uniref:DUF8039 domain-containing protein n=1 Tax=Asparagus officinalis TaxID=4686 RepID=A0A5P1FJE1_ASPOF|nr:uncharacterized protein A4U43_C02F15620 [Asparagus officinalis]